MHYPLISIITPVFNSENFIAETIKSVVDQTYTHWELILIDDGSKDNSVAIIKSIEKQDSRVKLIRHSENLGVAEARNTGIRLAEGNFIAFIDSDDIWDNKKLDSQLSFMKSNNCVLSHTAYRKIDENGNILVALIPVSTSVNYTSLLKHNEIGLSTAMYNVDVLGKRYLTTIGWEDFSLWLNILKDSYVSLGMPQPMVSYRIHQQSSSYNKLKSAKKTWKVYRQVEQFSFLKSLFYFTFYAVNASIKYLRK